MIGMNSTVGQQLRVSIEPLTSETLERTIELLDGAFGHDPREREGYRRALPLSITGPTGLALAYFVARSEDGEVVGSTGLYEDADPYEVLWIAWLCVDPEARGEGIGGQLLDFTITEARARGRRNLSVLVPAGPGWESARHLYRSRGFSEATQLGRRGPRMVHWELVLEPGA